MKERRLKWHPESSSDLSDITRYCNLSFGRKVAAQVRTEILEAAELLRRHPHLGAVEPLLEGCTSLQYRGLLVNHQTKVIYSVHADYIYIHLLWNVKQNEQTLKQTVSQRYQHLAREQRNMLNDPQADY